MLELVKGHPDWAFGFADEVWWSREALPTVHTFTEKKHPLHLVERQVPSQEKSHKAIACYGMFFRSSDQPTPQSDHIWLRFVEKRPVSELTIQYLDWVTQRLSLQQKRVLVLVWDNASWHRSKKVQSWIFAHNLLVKQQGEGVRILPCFLPVKSPWLNPIEPKWVAGKRSVVEPASLLSVSELMERVCSYYHFPLLPCLSISNDDS